MIYFRCSCDNCEHKYIVVSRSYFLPRTTIKFPVGYKASYTRRESLQQLTIHSNLHSTLRIVDYKINIITIHKIAKRVCYNNSEHINVIIGN